MCVVQMEGELLSAQERCKVRSSSALFTATATRSYAPQPVPAAPSCAFSLFHE
jgi:hypothetical protein